MTKLEETRSLLCALQVPPEQQADVCCYALLAMANLREPDSWSEASNHWIRIHDIISFTRDAYGVFYAENSRETFRKQAMHNFRNAAFIEDNGTATNSPNYRYRLTDEMLALICLYGSDGWGSELKSFLSKHESLIELYSLKSV